MYNRFQQVWCPGSTFKPIIAAIGLESGAIDPMEEYGNEGLSWQKDSSWGSYCVTTLHTYEPVILENALIYSDNIYFAKAALKIGTEEMESSLTELGFNEEIPFDIKMAKSQYSNTENIEWTVTIPSDCDWVSLVNVKAYGEAVKTVKVEPYDELDGYREVTLTVAAGSQESDFTISQYGPKSCLWSVDMSTVISRGDFYSKDYTL